MNAVQLVHHALQFRIFGYKVKYKAVEHILHQRPDEHAGTVKKGHQTQAHQAVGKGVVKQKNNNRNVQTVNDNGVGFGHHFQVFALEKPSLALVFDFLNVHGWSVNWSYEYNTATWKRLLKIEG